MQLKALWEVYGPGGRFDEDGNFVPTEKFGILPSIFMNVVILPIVAISFAVLLLLEFLPRNIVSRFRAQPGRGVDFDRVSWR